MVDVLSRFWGRVNKIPYGCWEWTGYVSKPRNGYGEFWIAGKTIRTHRFSYEIHFGPIPKGFQVCHHCDNTKCVRPDHLFCGTNQDNARDAIQKGRRFLGFLGGVWVGKDGKRGLGKPRGYRFNKCPNGHPYTNESRRVYANGWQTCGICERERTRRYRARRAARVSV
jgi:hypothetical protein